MKNWRADPEAFSVIFRSVFQVKKMGDNGRLIGVLIQMVFWSFFDLGIRLKKWMKMGELIGPGFGVIEPSDTPLLDTHFTPISEDSRVKFLGCFRL